jgi:hypothetical protein
VLLQLSLQVQMPFQRFKPHALMAGILPARARPGRYAVPAGSPLHHFCNTLCQTGGSWNPSQSPVVGYRLVGVEAILHEDAFYSAYEYRQTQLLNLRVGGNAMFNVETESMMPSQLAVLSCLRERFHERAPGTNPRAVNTFYTYHGPRREHLDSICANGLVATKATDAGYFGGGCYSTLNIEYAIKYARGVYDFTKPRPASPDKRYPVIMCAASIAMAYPVTPEVDYPTGRQSNLFGRSLLSGFDCHIACVSEEAEFQAVDRQECQYVEVVIEQVSQILPVAVLWFEEEADDAVRNVNT